MKALDWTKMGIVVASLLLWIGAVPVHAAQVGDSCDHPVGEICGNAIDDDGDGLIGCMDPDCTPAGAAFVCSPNSRLVPACRPLLDDPAKIRFKWPNRLDKITVVGRGIPYSSLDPATEGALFLMTNVSGVIYSEAIGAGQFEVNKKGTRWKYRLKRTNDPRIYTVVIRKHLNRKTGEIEYILRFKIEADAALADPERNTSYTAEALKNMTTQISVGDDHFYINADFERKNWGWLLRDKYMQTF